MSVLGTLVDILFPPRESELLVRNMRAQDLESFSNPVEVVFENLVVTALLPYQQDLVRACVTETKFHTNKKATKALADVLQRYLLKDGGTSAVILPIPLAKSRLRERGYNQLEEVLRQVDAHVLSCHMIQTSLLLRTRDTQAQTSLSKEARLLNMIGAFSVQNPHDPNVHYIILDDVITTGATMRSAHEALIASGAKKVTCLALAH